MAGGGHVIIRSALRAAASLDIVKNNISTNKHTRLDEVLAKADGDWNDDETHFVSRCIGDAYDAVT